MSGIGKRLTDAETERVRVMAAYIDASPHEWPKGLADVALLCHGYLDLMAELAEARRDGERYRYLRDVAFRYASIDIGGYGGESFFELNSSFRIPDPPNFNGEEDEVTPEVVDAAIDAARGGAK